MPIDPTTRPVNSALASFVAIPWLALLSLGCSAILPLGPGYTFGEDDAAVDGSVVDGGRSEDATVPMDAETSDAGATCEPACATDERCLETTCCPMSTDSICDGACVDTQSDSAHCGGCGVACEPTEACSGGRCGPTLALSVRGGGAGNDRVHDMVVSAAGDAYVIGRLRQEGDWNGEVERRDTGAFIAAIGADGSVRWWQTLSSSGGTVYVDAVRLSPSEDAVHVAGRFSGTATFGTQELTRASSTLVMLTLDPSSGAIGSVFSSRGSGEVPEVLGLAVDSSGNRVITARIRGIVALEDTPYSTTREQGTLLASLNTTDDVRWARPLEVGFAHVAGGEAGRVFLFGGLDAPANIGGSTLDPAAGNAFVAGFSAAGAHQWSRAIGGAAGRLQTLSPGALDADDLGGPVLVAGYYEGSEIDGEPLPDHGLVIAALDTDGSTRWIRTYRSVSEDSALLSSRGTVNNGRVYVCGAGIGVSDFGWGSTDVGDTDASRVGLYLVSHDLSSGTARWLHMVPRAAGFPSPVAVSASTERVYVTGTFGDALDFGVGPLITAGQNDLFLAAFDD